MEKKKSRFLLGRVSRFFLSVDSRFFAFLQQNSTKFNKNKNSAETLGEPSALGRVSRPSKNRDFSCIFPYFCCNSFGSVLSRLFFKNLSFYSAEWFIIIIIAIYKNISKIKYYNQRFPNHGFYGF